MDLDVGLGLETPRSLAFGEIPHLDAIGFPERKGNKRTVMTERGRIVQTWEHLFGENKKADEDLIENIHYKKREDGSLDRSQANGLKFLNIPDLNLSYNLFDKEGKVRAFGSEAVMKRVDKAIDTFIKIVVLSILINYQPKILPV